MSAQLVHFNNCDRMSYTTKPPRRARGPEPFQKFGRDP